MNPKASATAMVILVVLVLIVGGAISAFIKVQMQASSDDLDNQITGMAMGPEAETSEPAKDEEPTDIEPPKEPNFKIE